MFGSFKNNVNNPGCRFHHLHLHLCMCEHSSVSCRNKMKMLLHDTLMMKNNSDYVVQAAEKKSHVMFLQRCLIDTLSDLQLNNRHVAALCVRIDACLTSCCSRNTWQINKGILALPSLLLHMLWHGRKLCLNQVRFRPISADGHAAEKLVNFDFCW